tara:strand:- start:157 stop:531 length:375 start_codon:yes stop_codon:yes gene_type:complete
MNKLIKIFCNSCLVFLTGISFVFAEENISNTSWYISDDDGHEYVFQFNPDGTCPYFKKKSPTGNTGKIYDNCKWVRKNKVLVFETNNYYAVRIGRIEGRSMTGYVVSNHEVANKSTFIGRRIDN